MVFLVLAPCTMYIPAFQRSCCFHCLRWSEQVEAVVTVRHHSIEIGKPNTVASIRASSIKSGRGCYIIK